MSKLYNGSICLSDLIEKAKLKHSAYSKAKNDKIYVNINIWLNDEPDKYGNEISLQLNSKKELRETEGKVYIGNAKSSKQESKPNDNIGFPEIDDIPF